MAPAAIAAALRLATRCSIDCGGRAGGAGVGGANAPGSAASSCFASAYMPRSQVQVSQCIDAPSEHDFIAHLRRVLCRSPQRAGGWHPHCGAAGPRSARRWCGLGDRRGRWPRGRRGRISGRRWRSVGPFTAAALAGAGPRRHAKTPQHSVQLFDCCRDVGGVPKMVHDCPPPSIKAGAILQASARTRRVSA